MSTLSVAPTGTLRRRCRPSESASAPCSAVYRACGLGSSPARRPAWITYLSGDRLILSLGLGAIDPGYAEFGEIVDRRKRVELLDAGLAMLIRLWAVQPFAHDGKHYTIKPSDLIVPQPPVHKQIPIWVPGVWSGEKSMARAFRSDGLFPHVMDSEGNLLEVTLDAVQQMRAHANEVRGQDSLFDIVVEGQPDLASAADRARLVDWQSAGATWWIEEMWGETCRSDATSLGAVADRAATGLSEAP